MSCRYFASLVLLVAALSLAGCASDRDEGREHINQLWRQGYGFNNPNAERIKKGLAPLDFGEPAGPVGR